MYEGLLVPAAQLQHVAGLKGAHGRPVHTADDEIREGDTLQIGGFPEQRLLFGGHPCFQTLGGNRLACG